MLKYLTLAALAAVLFAGTAHADDSGFQDFPKHTIKCQWGACKGSDGKLIKRLASLIADELKDPDSLKIRSGFLAIASDDHARYGCFTITARNGFGGMIKTTAMVDSTDKVFIATDDARDMPSIMATAVVGAACGSENLASN